MHSIAANSSKLTILGLQSSVTQTQNVFETFQFSNFN